MYDIDVKKNTRYRVYMVITSCRRRQTDDDNYNKCFNLPLPLLIPIPHLHPVDSKRFLHIPRHKTHKNRTHWYDIYDDDDHMYTANMYWITA